MSERLGPSGPRAEESIPPVAGFGERVGAEGRELLRRHDVGDGLGDPRIGVGEVEVVDAL